ncbi:C2HC-type zinc-finger domain-containing protein [Spironucleus salmonicida]|uniref:C2HC-type zinc-finger domain-containing protein n=1 Tax=Spironucleus salmonicida TaxID=348837 RepID=V6M5Y3_9EUKA|nr:C2HC-type zinc-finger domain-containing protein [Spironucleus salmonicida]|eukprot:EST48764.1 hypothetical protein SS50377_11087 [Spironucleus salmonicida]
MNVQNGLVCRFCGKKWFKHDIVPHEKNCRLKIVKMVDVLYQSYRIQLLYPPEIEEWPVPPKISLINYNNHASKHFQATWQPCPKCTRAYPPIALADHINECDGEGPIRKANAPIKKAELRGTIKPGQMVAKAGTMMDTQKGIGSPLDAPQDLPLRRPETNSGTIGGQRGASQQVEEYAQQDTSNDDRMGCSRCGRKFAMNRIAAHEKICNKLRHGPPPGPDEFHKKDKTDAEWARTGFDPARYDTMGAAPSKFSGAKGAVKKPQTAPKRPVDPFAAQAMTDGRIACKRCGRGFAKDRIEKHETICKGLENFVQYAPVGGSTDRAKVGMGQATKQPRVSLAANTASQQRVPAVPQSRGAAAPKAPVAGGIAPRGVLGSNSAARPPQNSVMSPSGAKFCHECGTPYAGQTAKFCMECGEKKL